MQLLISRLSRWASWSLVTLLVLSAIVITSLRIALPHLSHFQKEITQWVSQQTDLNISVSGVSGYWHNAHPYISLQHLNVDLPDGSKASFSVDNVDLELDIFHSLVQRQWVVSKLNISNLDLDISSLNLLSAFQNEDKIQEDEGNSDTDEFVRTLDNIFLHQLDRVVISGSSIHYRSFLDEKRTLLINQLKWVNTGHNHRAEGNVSIAETGLNSLDVNAEFADNGSFKDINGEFYVNANHVAVAPWLTHYLKKQVGISEGEVNFDGWVTLRNSQPVKGLVALKPSSFKWGKNNAHELYINQGLIELFPTANGVRATGREFDIRTDKTLWPELHINLDWQKNKQVDLNINQVEIASLLPFAELVPDLNTNKNNGLFSLNPSGLLTDLRMSYSPSGQYKYSASLTNGSMHQWELLPEVHKFNADIYGAPDKVIIQANLKDDVLPYGDVFQAPLNIKDGYTNFVWQKQNIGWSLWSDKVSVITPDLQAIGAFRLDFPSGESPFLSFYTEVDVSHAGETWRYLPTRALGSQLTDYLSAAIQDGHTKTAKLIWYGPLKSFPYEHHNGVFQVWVPLKNGKFKFDPHWPAVDELNINLLFENDALNFEADSAKLQNANVSYIKGSIAHLNADGVLSIDAKVAGSGPDVHRYMLETPLADSVGAALTTLKVTGNVNSQLKLAIPLTSKKQPRAWGWATLKNNSVSMPSLSLNLSHVSGKIQFDNDVINATGINARLLDQKISLDFHGKNNRSGYGVRIDSIGDWQIQPLGNYIDRKWIDPLKGKAPWQLGVDIQLTDTGFNYQAKLDAQLRDVASKYPFPLNKTAGQPVNLNLQVSGNKESVNARVEVPDVKYQTVIDISSKYPVIRASNLVFGKGSYKVTPFAGHYASIRLDEFNLDDWLPFFAQGAGQQSSSKHLAKSSFPEIPTPEVVNLDVKTLKLATMEWHDVALNVKKKNLAWLFELNSQESKGDATYIEPYDLSVSLDRMHLYIPALEQLDEDNPLVVNSDENHVGITDFERDFYRLMPNLRLVINDFWLQGYKVGKVDMDLQRQENQLRWKNVDIVSGSNEVHAKGLWTLKNDISKTHIDLTVKGENNSEILERFGISSGIQKAPFSITSSLNWTGSPWSTQMKTLNGKVSTEFGQGSVSDVSGAAKLLGLFSLDSIIRKMKLDFSDIFDKGLAFDSITGDGEISHGVFVTNNLTMDTVAGDMDLKGLVDLDKRTIDAQVKFIPDVTSGLPVLSAFAVSPPTALYVLAVATVISPVVEVFTEVNYQVKGAIDSPEVKEISRTKGEYKLPGYFTDEIKKQEK